MSRVHVLPDELVNQIAAGEVVERPASAVKELVENALDAEASRVEVGIDEGGIRLLWVADDGCGLSREDARLSFERHATSKIATAADLAGVGTLGFRGEALPSIAAVARVRMRTRRAEDPAGVELLGDGRGIARVREIACPAGTRVEVAELFGELPARRKFLKSPVTEAGHVVRWLERIALARPDVRFSLERDGKPSLLFLPTADLRERVMAVLPPSLGERLLPVQGESPSARLRGLASPTDVRRGSAADIHLYVNGRPLRDRLLLAAVHDVYREALPPGRHPAAVLYLDVEPGEVDVNVHPAKWEVRFRDPGSIMRLVRGALARAIGAASHLYAPAGAGGGARGLAVREPGQPVDRAPHFQGAPIGSWLLAHGELEAAPASQPGSQAPPLTFRSLRFVGQALGTFLVLEGEAGLVLLDQHAAHERVLFERLRAGLLDGKLEPQALLVPFFVELPRSSADALIEHSEALLRCGLELEPCETTARGGVRVAVRSVPAVLAERRGIDLEALLEETAAELRDPARSSPLDGIDRALHAALATAACHAACRKGDRLDPREVQALLEALDASVWFPNCPHGRPILWLIGAGELERRFLRR